MRKILCYFCFCIICLTVFLTGGCSKQKEIMESDNKKEEQTAEEQQEHSFEKQYSENVSVNIENVPQISEEKGSKWKISKAYVDLKQMREIVFSEDKSTETVDSPWKNVEQLTTQDGLLLIQDETVLMGRTKEWDRYSDFIGFRELEGLSMTQSTETDLAFLSREDAKEKVQKITQQLFPDIQYDEIVVDAYTKEYFTELIDYIEEIPTYRDFIKSETKDQVWQDSDEIYCVTITFKEDDIPMQKKDFILMDETTIWGSKMIVWLSEKGVQKFEGYGLWKKEKEEEVTICTLENAIEALNGKYQNIVTEEKITITKAELEYSPLTEGITGELFLTPVWALAGNAIVTMRSADGTEEQVKMTKEIHVNAETGKLIE